ncbi:MAG: triphosphoribosyl-dephospho-CoA synthase [Promethearchaeota archaeon]
MSAKETPLILSIKSLEDLLICVNLASLLELAGWPKPGNVHRTKNFENTRFEHFLAGIVAIQPNFRSHCEKVFQLSFNNDINYKSLELGKLFKDTAQEMIRWQSGGNVVLGHILILSPLVTAATICLKTKKNSLIDFRGYLRKIIDNSSVNDTVSLFKAIKLSNPGGLGKVDKYDINDQNSIKNLIEDEISLKEIFDLSKEYDLIAFEYSTGFTIILEEGLPYFFESFKKFHDLNIAIVNTFLYLLSIHPDTLIIRKSGLEAANYVSHHASIILKKGGISTEEGLQLTSNLDVELQKKKGSLNPGTTADLIAGIIFCALIFGLRF